MLVFSNWRGIPALAKACAGAEIKINSLAVWDKVMLGTGHGNQLRSSYEVILFCAKGNARIEDRSQRDIFSSKWNQSNHGKTSHKSEKPLELMERLVELVTAPGDLVLDPFMGSGTTGVAALKKGRMFLGVEMHPPYFEAACQRLQNTPRT